MTPTWKVGNGMQIVSQDFSMDAFFERVAHAARRVLMVDYDGTLAPFTTDRDHAIPYPGVADVLSKIIEAGNTRVVVISGRSMADLLRVLPLTPLPELWASHGWERRMTNGDYDKPELNAESSRVLQNAYRAALFVLPTQQIEEKPTGIAAHWRGMSPLDVSAARLKLTHEWAASNQFDLHEFDGGLELRLAGKNKGFAVKTILSETDAGAAVSYLGDDRTDEDAFEALDVRGCSVLVREDFRATKANVWLRPPSELIAFLARWLRSSQQVQQ